MGRLVLIVRLATRDIRHRPAQAALAILAIGAACAVLTLGLVLRGVTANPYAVTKAATRGPDVVAQFGNPAQAKALLDLNGVTAHGGPYPVAGATLRDGNTATLVMAVGRDESPAAVDQPMVTQGSWVSPGKVVLERTFAAALNARPGSRISLNGRPFTVAGIAVTAANPPYPNLCYTGCDIDVRGDYTPGLVWLTAADVTALKTPLSYQLSLTLKNPATARDIASDYAGSDTVNVFDWQQIQAADGLLVTDEQQILSPASWLAVLLALASVAVLVGGRIVEQAKRVGLLKASGATPELVGAVLLAEHLLLALVAAALGLLVGWAAAPLLTSPGAGLIGASGHPSLSMSVIETVLAVALAVALTATLVPVIRAARTSTVRALNDSARTPRRRARLIWISARLPVPMLIGVRLMARRPRRALLVAASTAVTMSGIVAVLAFHATPLNDGSPGLGDPVAQRDNQTIMALTIVLVTLAAVNAITTAWATAMDARHPSAVTRVLGVTPRQLAAGLGVAQVLPALPGALVAIPAGIGLYRVANSGGALTVPPAAWLAAATIGALVAVALLAAIPARAGARRPPAVILRAETG
jgi:putative ABC transport system permease protein